MTEHVTQVLDDKPVQTPEKAPKKHKKTRSQSDKVGRHKYNQQLLKRCLAEIDDIKRELRWIRRMLERLGIAEYTVSDVERFAVVDEVDREIIQCVLEAGALGIFPKDVAAAPALVKYRLKYYHVARRIVRMNKKLHFETGKVLFEKRGHRWALTSFGFDVWGETENQRS